MVRLVPVAEAREILGGIGVTKFYELVAAGDVQVVKIGRRSFVPSESLDQFIAKVMGGDAA